MYALSCGAKVYVSVLNWEFGQCVSACNFVLLPKHVPPVYTSVGTLGMCMSIYQLKKFSESKRERG